MTFTQRRNLSLRRNHRQAIAGTAAFAIAAVIGALLISGAAAQADPPTAPVVQASTLVAATTGQASTDYRAVGHDAKLLNAALPFNGGPVQPASPFTAPRAGTDYDRALLCLTQAVYYEAGYEPLQGRRAVAQVVLNRMRHPAFPNSVCGVVYQGSTSPVCQFSFVCDGALYRTPAAAGWRQSAKVARRALAGYVEATVGGSTHYHADYVSPRWAPLLAKVNKIGAHIFYRWPGAWGHPRAFASRYIGEPTDPFSMRPALRTGDIATLTPETLTAQLAAGPSVRRAANDVGGLLDTTKGWTLNIPAPAESQGAAARMLAQQASSMAPKATVIAATATPLSASK